MGRSSRMSSSCSSAPDPARSRSAALAFQRRPVRSSGAMARPASRGNVQKYRSFAWAFSQMKKAIEAGFYIEAVAIAESVIADRLSSFVASNDAAAKPTKREPRLVDLIKKAHALEAMNGPLEP